MNETSYCVAWSRETNRLEMAPLEVVVNLNIAAFLEDKLGRVVIRTSCTEEDARRFIRAYAALMAKRSIERLDAEAKEVNP